MYILVDPSQAKLFADKEEAAAEAARLGLTVYSPASNKVPEQLELLYALTIQLLKVGKVNPLYINVKLTDLLGQTREITARQIVNDARAYLDATDSDELRYLLRKIREKILDPMPKAMLDELIGRLP